MVEFEFSKLATRVRHVIRHGAPPNGGAIQGYESIRFCGCNSMVESEFSKLVTRVRFPSPAPFFVKLGISANFLTWLGLLFSFISACAIIHERFFLAGTFLLISGYLDLLDGSVARAAGKAKPFGGILDSSLDRYGDGFVLGAAILHFMALGQLKYAALALSALIGSFSISYVRARAECEVDDCRVGFWERGERLVLIALALLSNRLEASLWILGVATHWTVFQRVYYSKLRTENSKTIPLFLKQVSRDKVSYYIKVGIILAVLFLLPK